MRRHPRTVRPRRPGPGDIHPRLQPPARERYDGRRSFVPYLFVIAKNILRDRVRRFAVWRAWLERQRPLDATTAVSPEAIALDKELVEAYREFKAGLDHKERIVWELRVEQDATRAEVESETGVTVAQIRRLEIRLRRRLAKRLRRGGSDIDLETLRALCLCL